MGRSPSFGSVGRSFRKHTHYRLGGVVMEVPGSSALGMVRLARHKPKMRRCFLTTEVESKHVPAANVCLAARQLSAELPKRPVAVGLWESHVTRSNTREGGLGVPKGGCC